MEKITIIFINPKIDPFLVARRVIGRKCRTLALVFICLRREDTLPTAEILSGKNARAWVSMVLYLKK